jgi:hypothetical protein
MGRRIAGAVGSGGGTCDGTCAGGGAGRVT